MKQDWELPSWTPPTEEEQFEAFCYEMYMKMKDEVLLWEGKVSNASPKEYIKKNKSMLEKEFKRLQKKGNI